MSNPSREVCGDIQFAGTAVSSSGVTYKLYTGFAKGGNLISFCEPVVGVSSADFLEVHEAMQHALDHRTAKIFLHGYSS